jgi:hypothetical protein
MLCPEYSPCDLRDEMNGEPFPYWDTGATTSSKVSPMRGCRYARVAG